MVVIDGVPLSVADLSGWGLATVLVVANIMGFLKGWVHPNSTVQAFKSAWETSQEAGQKKDEALAELLPTLRTIVKLLQDLQDSAQRKEE